MKYPKPLMSFTELENAGFFSRDVLSQYSRMARFPHVRTSKAKNAKILVITDELDEWLEKNKLKSVSSK